MVSFLSLGNAWVREKQPLQVETEKDVREELLRSPEHADEEQLSREIRSAEAGPLSPVCWTR